MNPSNSKYNAAATRTNHAFVAVLRKMIIILLDVDCFYVQLWMKKLRPDLIGKDVPVVVISSDRRILSVNYTAKSLGVKREEALSDAQYRCLQAGQPLIEIIVPERYGKDETFFPQTEGDLILDAIVNYVKMLLNQDNVSPSVSVTVERNGNDEFYIDVTQFINEGEGNKAYYADPTNVSTLDPEEIYHLNRLKNHPNRKYNCQHTTIMEDEKAQISGQEFSSRVRQVYPLRVAADHTDELRLVQGTILANAIIEYIKSQTGYDVSAGVGHSKLVAKLACGRNKPKGVTIMTDISLPWLSKSISFRDLPGYAGPDGQRIQSLLFSKWMQDEISIDDLFQSINKDYKNLVPMFQKLNSPDPVKSAMDLYNMCQFKDDSPVIPRLYYPRFSTGLSFKGLAGRLDLFQNRVWDLANDMGSRINYYTQRGRQATELVVKAVVFQTCTTSPRNFANRITLPVEYFLTADCVNNFIWDYINQNNLNYQEVKHIKLTALKIIFD